MNESFSDLSVLGDFETNEDYMPFIRSLEQGGEKYGYGNVKRICLRWKYCEYRV